MCCGYMAFFLSENEFSSSGVIATVSAGLAVAHSAWPLFVSRETVHTVWEAIEFVGNTVIFFLAGLIFMGCVLERGFGITDFSWLLTLYVGMILVRAFMLAVFWIPLNLLGEQLVWQEGVVMCWSGLRGAVSLAMGMIVDIEPNIDSKTGSQVMFHVGGVAALTLLVNAVGTAPLLKLLGLVKTEHLMSRVSSKLSATAADHVRKCFEKEIQNPKDVRFHGANSHIVHSMVPMLRPETEFRDGSEEVGVDQWTMEKKMHQVFREVFLRVVQNRYWQGIQEGVIPRQLMVSRVLLHSSEEALDNTWEQLKDWDIIARSLKLNVGGQLGASQSERALSKLVDVWPFRMIPQFRKASIDFQMMMTVFIALSYVEAHTFAQEEIQHSLGRDDALDVKVQQKVVEESNKQREMAMKFISHIPHEFVELGKSEMLARRLLRQHMHEVDEKQECGFLTKTEAEHLNEPCLEALRNIEDLPMQSWKDILPKDEKDQTPGGSSGTMSRGFSGSRGFSAHSGGGDFSSRSFSDRVLRGATSQVPLVDTMLSSGHQVNDPGAALLPGAQTHTSAGLSAMDSGLRLPSASVHPPRLMNPTDPAGPHIR